MADEPPPGQPGYEPLPGWPSPPDPRPGATRPPSAPPPGWTGPQPDWTREPGQAAVAPPPPAPAPAPTGGRLAALRSRRGLAVAGGALALLVLAAVLGVVVIRGGDGSTGTGDGIEEGGSATAPKAAPGDPLPVLDGRVVVTARPGWEARDNAAETATVKLQLAEPTGRELLATLVLTALPGGGPLDQTLTIAGGTRFEVKTGWGPLQAVAVPGAAAQVVAATVRLPSTYVFSLSVFAVDGAGLDVPLIQKLFVEQVVPQLRFT